MSLFDLFKNSLLRESTLGELIKESELLFRPMDEEDLWGVMTIENMVYQFPWSERVFRDCLNNGYSCWVCEGAGIIVAYGIVSMPAAEEAHILNICVHPDAQMGGVGRKMMDKLIRTAFEYQAQTIFLEVRPSNRGAIRLYERLGFEEIGVRKGYYQAFDQQREDALVMALKKGNYRNFEEAC